jgi:hypothetical protein
MALIGSTIRLRAEFKTFDGNFVDPSSITLKIYDSKKKQIGSNIPIGLEYRISTGIYEYDYIVPDGIGDLYYEFSGIVYDSPVVGRGIITRNWM